MSYLYSKSSDFPGGFEIGQFSDSILNSSIGSLLITVKINGDVINIKFTTSLTAPQLTVLTNLISTHVPYNLDVINFTQYKESTGTIPSSTDDFNKGYSIGALWRNTTQNNMYMCVDNTGSNALWKIVGGGGISTLNTLTNNTQTFAVGTTGTDFAINSSTSTHTFNVPDASTTARGLVTVGSQTFTGTKGFNILAANSATVGTIGINNVQNIAYVASSSNGGANLTSFIINVPTGTMRDMIMVCHMTIRGNTASNYGSAVAPSGWQLLRTIQNTDNSSFWRTMYVYIKFATASEPSSYTWSSISPASNYCAGGIATFSGVAAFNIINAEASQATPNSLSHDVPVITTTVPNTMLISYYSYASCATSWNIIGGMTQMYQGNSSAPPATVGEGCLAAYKFQSATGAVGGTGVFTATASNDADAGLTNLLALTQAINIITPTTNSAFDFGVKNASLLNMGNQNCPTNMYRLTAYAGYPNVDAMTVVGAAGQSVNIMDIQNSSGTFLSGFNSSGQLMLGGNTSNTFCYTIAPTLPTADRIITLPNLSGTLVCQTSTDTLTNKTITGTTNTVRASQLGTTSTDVVVSTAAAPISGQILTATSVSAAAWQTPQHWIFRDEKTSGTNGGAFTAGSWVTRTLQTISYNGGSLATLSSNQITLQAGTYKIIASAIGNNVGIHQTRIYNVTGAVAVAYGLVNKLSSVDASASITECMVSPGTATVYRLEHRCSTTNSTDGMGIAAGFGNVEVYASVNIEKIL